MKILSAVFVVKVGKPMQNADEMIRIMEEHEADVYLFPAYCLTGATINQAVGFRSFADMTNEALDKICEYSEQTHKCIVTAVAGYDNIIIRDGDLIQKPAVTHCGKKIVVSQSGDEGNADILLLPTAMSGYPCIQNDIIEFCADASKAKNCVIAVANAGFGESSADSVYKGFAGVFNTGIIEDFKGQERPEPIMASADTDVKSGLIYSRPNKGLDRIPYFGKNEPSRYLNELFLLQTQALYTRISGTGINKLVVGVSGGLDSTAALLCSVNAMKMAALPIENIIAVTMPCFGTGSRTYSNANRLMQALGVARMEIDIKASVLSHFRDLGITSDEQGSVYENAQARERAQVLMDIANMHNGLVVGTGDLSEAALGFCTFGGDTLCHYNVNATIPKTVIREMVKNIAENSESEELKRVLLDIVDTPISPELRLGQKTEEIIGPYELHDFFIFFFAKRRNSYTEIKNYALAVFEEYDEAEIVKWLDVFYARYRAAQFKRSNSYEGANLIGFTLPYVPADIGFDFA